MGGELDHDEALRQLYSSKPDEFLSARSELADALRSSGHADAADDIAERRKPTLAAWIVNALTLHDDSVRSRIAELGDKLRTTQHALDAPKLRELSAERRRLIAELTEAALGLVGRARAATGLRSDVSSTFDGAVADPDIAARLGQLQRAEQFAGFGFAESGPPQLTLVRGGKPDDGTNDGTSPPTAKRTAAERRRHQRLLDAARTEYETAQTKYDEAEQHERDACRDVNDAERELAQLKQRLEIHKRALEDAREDLTRRKKARRETRNKFERLEREDSS